MEATTIDQLFPEVLEEIFSHLNASDVKNCALVCKKWDEVIGSSEITMKKFKLRFQTMRERDDDPQMQDELQQRCSTREHRNLHIEFIDRPAKPLSSILEHYDLSQVKELTFFAEFNEPIKTIIAMTLLSRMPLLQDLGISFYHTKFDNADSPIVTLPKLRKLRVNEGVTADSIFKFIVAPNITHLEYTEGFAYPGNEYSYANIDSLAGFIKDKKSLANLSLTTILFQKLIGRHDLSEMRLKSLSLRLDSSYDPDPLEYFDIAQVNLKKILLTNADSLISLQIPARFISKEVFVAIFIGLRKLATLKIDEDVNVSGSWMENLSPNRTLKSLELTPTVMNDGLKKILQLSPHIESLSLSYANDSLLNRVAASHRRLVKLEIVQLVQNVRGGLRFNELKSLRLHKIDEVDRLASLLVSCPKIETFEFFKCSELEVNNIVDILLQQNTLKHLRLPLWPQNLSRNMFDQLKDNYGNLRSASFRSHTVGIGRRSYNVIQFDFPEHSSEWNIEEQEARFASHWRR